MKLRHLLLTAVATLQVATAQAQILEQEIPPQKEKNSESPEPSAPIFAPMVKVGKVLDQGDSIQYIEMNNTHDF